MNANMAKVGLAIIAVIAIVLVFSATFVVDQRQQAIVLQLGSVRAVKPDPGLYFKLPIIENVVFVDKRVLDLDSKVQDVLAKDKEPLVIETFTRFQITNPLRFYQTVGSVAGARQRLEQLIDSVTRATLAESNFSAIVKDDRAGIMKRIREEVNEQTRTLDPKPNDPKKDEQKGLGIEIVDVRLKRVDLPPQNSEFVYQRMKTERQREAADIRAQGQQVALGIRARADRDVTVIIADATRKSEELRGQGDAERNRIYNEAFGKDHDFFGFYRSMQAYESGLKAADTRLILSPDSDFFRYFNDPFGKSKNLGLPGAGAQGTPVVPKQ